MKKILVSLATTLMATATLVACNGTTGSDITSDGATTVSKAVCTSSNNWQSVGIGMSAGQVEERLGKPATITSTAASTAYNFERCRAGSFLEKEGTPATATEPAKPDEYATYYSSGSVTLSSSRGVIAVATPVLKSDKPMRCEWDLYNYPFNYAAGIGPSVCRTSNNPF